MPNCVDCLLPSTLRCSQIRFCCLQRVLSLQSSTCEKRHNLYLFRPFRIPLLWAAWEELASQIVTYELSEVYRLFQTSKPLTYSQLKHVQNQLPSLATSATNPCYLYFLFQTSKHLLTLQEASHALATLQSITNPNSTSIRLAEASMYYHHQNHPHSVALFTEIYTEHPSLLDKADEFANALYVLEFGPQLSHLAQRCVRVDEYRPETCVAVANYYSFKNDHEKAVAYLKRAVVLDAGNSLPWTLIGHEFLEMKNQAAAIEVYRKAVDINPRDFRAWYALGNIYQMLKMPLYALYYFQKATSLKQYDPRFWTGLGGCFEEVGQMNEAVRCLRRAVECDGAGNTELVRLARVYEKLGKGVCGGSTKGAMDAAAGCWKQVFDGVLLGRNGGKKGERISMFWMRCGIPTHSHLRSLTCKTD
ncbi:TPR-like protein [Rhizoclosmatium globosum]|uniref:TPR-like protein n=1 Tax=Rhizoclosmatium globosum TaxID=329046 RepID=A0A1Y2CA09_9FUNG|nr:TPR-like protein [Rhizoclosmatium globosum]|eukprot:ORY43870.1 TPR-like protein [Rhizoclosmatium globosum]